MGAIFNDVKFSGSDIARTFQLVHFFPPFWNSVRRKEVHCLEIRCMWIDVQWQFNAQRSHHYMKMCQLFSQCAVHASDVVTNILKLVE
jgi:hypothetical protein